MKLWVRTQEIRLIDMKVVLNLPWVYIPKYLLQVKKYNQWKMPTHWTSHLIPIQGAGTSQERIQMCTTLTSWECQDVLKFSDLVPASSHTQTYPHTHMLALLFLLLPDKFLPNMKAMEAISTCLHAMWETKGICFVFLGKTLESSLNWSGRGDWNWGHVEGQGKSLS